MHSMTRRDYDVITVGGGLGGAAFAKAMAERGVRVLVVERERRFADRVRGEALMSWGVAEARALDLEPLLLRTCGHVLRWNDLYVGPMQVVHRDLPETTVPRAPWLTFYHPAMQEELLAAAAAAGAEVRRGVRVRGVTPGDPPRVAIEDGGRAEELTSRLVVAADGRTSVGRNWGGFDVRRDPERRLFAGALFDNLPADPDIGRVVFNPDIGRISFLFPQGGGRVRAYVGYHKDADPPRGQGNDVDRFVAEAVRTGVDAALYETARPAGPLAMFEASDSWVPHPYRDGVALIGDAAATSDPTWGQGMSLTLRDARTLRDHLLAADDWSAAAHAYADDHDRYYDVIHTVDGWFSTFFMELGAEAQERRARAFPLLAQDPQRLPDALLSGPEEGADERLRRRFFAED